MRNLIKILSIVIVFSVAFLFVQDNNGLAAGNYRPLPEKVGVDQHHDWTIKFNGLVDSNSVNENTVYVEYNGKKVSGVKVSVSSDKRLIKVSAPSDGYITGGIYHLYIDGVKSANGEVLKSPRVMEFTIKTYGSKVDSKTVEEFFQALKKQELNTVKRMIDSEKDIINAFDSSGRTALINASRSGHLELVRLLLDEGANPNLQISSGLYKGETALHEAIRHNEMEVIHQLLKSKVIKLDVKNDSGRTPLMVASERDDIDIVKLLIGAGADLNVQIPSGLYKGETALHIATRQNHQEVVQHIIYGGADLNIKEDGGKTPLMMASERGNLEIAKMLIAAGADVNVQIPGGLYKGQTALHIATRVNKIDVVQELVNAPKINLNIQDSSGETPLMIASEKGNKEVTQMLINAGANPNIQKPSGLYKGQTALHIASRINRIEIVELLVKAPNINLNIQDDTGETPLMIAAEKDNPEVTQILVSSGANPNVQKPGGLYKGETALHFAARYNHPNVVRELLKAPTIKKNMKNNSGKTALDIAIEKKNQEVIQLLR